MCRLVARGQGFGMQSMNTGGRVQMRAFRSTLLVFAMLIVNACGNDVPVQPEVGAPASPVTAGESGVASAQSWSGSQSESAREHERTVKLQQYICRDAECEGSVLSAVSAEEAEWLLRHGYPSPAEARRLEGLPLELLEAEARSSNSAKLELAQRYADEGDTERAMSLAADVANSGGLYAYHRMSTIMDSRGPHRDRIDAAAYLRVAHILGDHRASRAMAESFAEFGPVESVIIDRRASGLYKTMAKNRLPDPRPFN